MHHVNPTPSTSSGSIDTVPLCRVNTPGILHGASMPLVPARRCPGLGYIIFIKCVFSSSFYCLSLLTLVFQASLTPPSTRVVPSSPHALRWYLHPLLAALTSPLPSSGFVDAGHCARLSTPPCKFFFLFFFVFVLFCLTHTHSMPACHVPTPHGITPSLPWCHLVASTPGPLHQHRWRSLHRCPGLGPIIFTID